MNTRVLTRRDIAALMRPADYLAAVEAGFASLAAGSAQAPAPLHLATARGGFHAKGAAMPGVHQPVALKFNANMPGNPAAFGLPTIQGAILLMDGNDGRLLAVMDSIEITLRRTAAASALAARYLARPQSVVLALIGCGAQALPQVEAMAEVLPLRELRLWDIDAARAAALREQLAMCASSLMCVLATDLAAVVRGADVIVTCTTAREAFLQPEHVAAGSFVAAVGTDSPAKSEITPALMARARLVVDSLTQCAEMGDLQHALAAGALRIDAVHAELGQLVLGSRPGRSSVAETWLFDSTGVAVQDVACAARVFELACERGAGVEIDLGGQS